MGLTTWTLLLAGAGVSGFFGRRWWIKRQQQAVLDAAKRKKRAEEAELDRLACEDLGQSLMSSNPGAGRKESSGGSGRTAGGSSG